MYIQRIGVAHLMQVLMRLAARGLAAAEVQCFVRDFTSHEGWDILDNHDWLVCITIPTIPG